MPSVKSELGYLAEMAAYDLYHDEESVLTEGQIRHTLNQFSTCDVTFTPIMTPVVKLDEADAYVTDVRYLVPFMESYGIKSVAEALDMVAEANDLPPKSVGIIETAGEKEIEEAKRTKNPKTKNALLDKLAKSVDLSKKLKDKGYPVAKKKGSSKKECGDNCSSAKKECNNK